MPNAYTFSWPSDLDKSSSRVICSAIHGNLSKLEILKKRHVGVYILLLVYLYMCISHCLFLGSSPAVSWLSPKFFPFLSRLPLHLL